MEGGRQSEGLAGVAPNVGGRERLVSMVLGGGLIALALTRRRPIGRLWLIPGVMLLARGRSGRSLTYTLFDKTTVPKAEDEAPRAQPPAESPHPAIPGTHEHPVPPAEMGAPSVRVTEKLMHEIAAAASGGTEPESEG